MHEGRERGRQAMTVEIQKIPGGLEVDGLKLRRGRCGCTSLAKCCYSWSKVKQNGSDIVVEAKLSAPDTKDNFEWGYTVSKDGVTVTVAVEDARDKEIYSGYIPPAVAEWETRGWTITEKTGASFPVRTGKLQYKQTEEQND